MFSVGHLLGCVLVCSVRKLSGPLSSPCPETLQRDVALHNCTSTQLPLVTPFVLDIEARELGKGWRDLSDAPHSCCCCAYRDCLTRFGDDIDVRVHFHRYVDVQSLTQESCPCHGPMSQEVAKLSCRARALQKYCHGRNVCDELLHLHAAMNNCWFTAKATRYRVCILKE